MSFDDEGHPGSTNGKLPLADFERLRAGAIAARISELDEPDLTRLLTHERAHANRLPVIVVLTARLDAMRDSALPASSAVE